MDMALSYFFVIIHIAYTLICVAAALLCLRLFLWPLSLRLATLVWAISNSGRHYFWQAANVQKMLTHLLYPVPFAELLFSQRLGAQLHQQLKPVLPRLISSNLEQHYPRTWASVYPNWQVPAQQFSSVHMAQLIDDFLDELRISSANTFSLPRTNMTSLTLKQRLENAQRLLSPVQQNLIAQMQVITWFVLAISAMLMLIIPFTAQGLIIYVGMAWLVMTFASVWRIHQENGLSTPLWTQWSQLLAADLSQHVYHLQPLFKNWQHGKLRQAMDNALDYQWGSAQFHAGLANQLLEQLMQISQQPHFGQEQQVAVCNDLFRQFRKTADVDQQILFAQITGNYWHILGAIVLLLTLLLTGSAYSYFK